MKTSILMLILILGVFVHSKVNAQINQEDRLIQSLVTLNNTSQYFDSISYIQNLIRFEKELAETLQNHEIILFKKFNIIADSVGLWIEQKQSESKDYTLFRFNFRNSNWNYILKNRIIIHEEKDVSHFFSEIHNLNQNEFLLIKQLNQLIYSCSEVFVYKNGIQLNSNKVLSVCSFTSADMSYPSGTV